MLGYYYLITILLGIVLITLSVIFRKQIATKKDLILKIISLVLLAVFFVRYMSGH